MCIARLGLPKMNVINKWFLCFDLIWIGCSFAFLDQHRQYVLGYNALDIPCSEIINLFFVEWRFIHHCIDWFTVSNDIESLLNRLNVQCVMHDILRLTNMCNLKWLSNWMKFIQNGMEWELFFNILFDFLFGSFLLIDYLNVNRKGGDQDKIGGTRFADVIIICIRWNK